MDHIKIGGVIIEKTAALAPMAGVGDYAMRTLCKEFGAAYVVGEMVSAKGIGMGSKKSEELLETTREQRPMAVQLFGSDPGDMAEAARRTMSFSPDIIDINMGCPAPKIAGNGGGAALMKDPELAGEIVKAVCGAVNVPVTVKIRKGWDAKSINAVSFARRMEDCGASALTIHGRTREQMYAPSADWEMIAEVKSALSIPVIGNGDITEAGDALRMYKETGVDLVMIGRGACGRPWIFSEIKALLAGREAVPPTTAERMNAMLRQIELMIKDKGEFIAMREARKHVAFYMHGLSGASKLRGQCGKITTMDDIRAIADICIELN